MFFNCDESFKNPECRFLAVIESVTRLRQDWSVSLIKVMIVLEILVLIKGLIISTIAIHVFLQKSSVHCNFSKIVIVFTAHFYVLAVCRFGLLLFETGILEMNISLFIDGKSLLLIVSSAIHIIEFNLGSQTRLIFAFILTEEFWKNCFRRHAVWSQRNVDMKNEYPHLVGDVTKLKFDWSISIIKITFALEILTLLIGLIFSTAAISVFVKDHNLTALFSELFNYICTTFVFSQHTTFVFSLETRFSPDNKSAAVEMNATFVFSVPARRRDFDQIISRFIPCISPPSSILPVLKKEKNEGDHYFNDLFESWDNRLPVNKRL
ncbi:hypothetical protein PRIPAC_81333 [Pristionchus pacificus]|uniref:Uncharacterized protein n=1 Tax=Pristionchus pacificus TaxID=54126 RepID=A0A2A6CP72_PRIPA|nr:hypothetical protein PRIPAC_81333 [Pristionchus pacificus]|eukprot:PDM79920.1 hypothetical protein PRIPAC_32499 [Pristionchus pacificus]